MSKEAKYVFVTWDPLLERVVCVHKKQNSTCKKCKKLHKQRLDQCWWLEVKKFKIKD